MLKAAELTTYSEAGRQFGVLRTTIADLARVMGIEPIRHPAIGNARGLTPDQMRLISKAIKPRRHKQSA